MTATDLFAPADNTKFPRRSLFQTGMVWLRRVHLYFGLLLFPWALLYGVTAFLFNHPTAFPDSQATIFGSNMVAGTPMESPGSPTDVANQIVAAMNERANGSATYTLLTTVTPAYNRDLSFALIKTADGQTINIGLDAVGNGGTVRAQPIKAEAKSVEKAPFTIGMNTSGVALESRRPAEPKPTGESLKLSDPLHERVKAAIPVVLERTGFPSGEITVTSVPDLTFHVGDQSGKTWKVIANVMAGTVSGTRTDGTKDSGEVSFRRFLLRLHTAYGYPSCGGIRWWWAITVDAMAFVTVFWALSGLLMWWQIKATRKLGVVLVLFSLIAAGFFAFNMHAMMTS